MPCRFLLGEEAFVVTYDPIEVCGASVRELEWHTSSGVLAGGEETLEDIADAVLRHASETVRADCIQ